MARLLLVLLIIERMLRLRGLDTVRLSKLKGHADEALVRAGRARDLDRLGNNGADEAADFGRRRVPWWVIDARRTYSGVRRVVHAVRDRSFLPGLPGIWDGKWGVVAVSRITCRDVQLWPYSVSMLVKWVAFLKTLHWPLGGVDLGVGGVSYVELLILCELLPGERLSLEKAHPRYLRPGRPISMSAVPFGPGIDIWRSYRFTGAMMRSLCLLPGGLGRFLPCSIGANHCGLRHIGWEKCGHGLTSRPRESALEGFLNELLVLFGSAAALLSGELPLRYCSGKFACRLLTWGLTSCGHVQGLVAEFAGIEEVPWSGLPGLVGGARVLRGKRILGGLKSSATQKNPSTPCRIWQGEFSVSSKGLEEIEG